jgi:NAD(P)-dependent dehydrogenase (short-subunit alcohol dehydrogenase family)
MGRLDGLAVLVVDAASRLGSAACAAFAQEGARVMVADADSAAASQIASRLGAGAASVVLDPLDPVSCEHAVDATRRELGRLDVLCNRAAAPPPIAERKLLHELTVSEWCSAIDAGLNAVALPTRSALRIMSEIGSGSILVVGSSAGLVGVPRLSAFSAAAGGLLNFTRNLALEAQRAGHAIRANMVCLGSTWDGLVPSQAERDSATVADADAIARVLVFLASSDSRHLNGAIVTADDGLTAWR